ncbi:MAG: rhodanese-like domain-containing protein [archaeon]
MQISQNILAKDLEKFNSYEILDVRTAEEFNNGHLKNAINIDYYDVNFENELRKLDKKKVYVIYCRSGSRSAIVLRWMKQLRFEEVYNIINGIEKLKNILVL